MIKSLYQNNSKYHFINNNFLDFLSRNFLEQTFATMYYTGISQCRLI